MSRFRRHGRADAAAIKIAIITARFPLRCDAHHAAAALVKLVPQHRTRLQRDDRPDEKRQDTTINRLAFAEFSKNGSNTSGVGRPACAGPAACARTTAQFSRCVSNIVQNKLSFASGCVRETVQ